MAYESDLRDFKFYQQYLWSPTDFDNFQKWVRGGFRNTFQAAFGLAGAVLEGLSPSLTGGMGVQVSTGAAVNPDGRFMLNPSAANITLVSAGQPRWSLVVLRPVSTDVTTIPDPLNPLVNVFLHTQLTASVVIIDGTPSLTPSYPAKAAGDVILFGVKMSASQSTLLIGDIDFGVSNHVVGSKKSLRQVSSNTTLTVTDEIVEVDATSGARVITLPSALLMAGREIRVLKVDSSANQVEVTGAQLISGQPSQFIDDQWGYVRIYSNGNAWRIS